MCFEQEETEARERMEKCPSWSPSFSNHHLSTLRCPSYKLLHSSLFTLHFSLFFPLQPTAYSLPQSLAQQPYPVDTESPMGLPIDTPTSEVEDFRTSHSKHLGRIHSSFCPRRTTPVVQECAGVVIVDGHDKNPPKWAPRIPHGEPKE